MGKLCSVCLNGVSADRVARGGGEVGKSDLGCELSCFGNLGFGV
jgi:hypothetical protein